MLPIRSLSASVLLSQLPTSPDELVSLDSVKVSVTSGPLRKLLTDTESDYPGEIIDALVTLEQSGCNSSSAPSVLPSDFSSVPLLATANWVVYPSVGVTSLMAQYGQALKTQTSRYGLVPLNVTYKTDKKTDSHHPQRTPTLSTPPSRPHQLQYSPSLNHWVLLVWDRQAKQVYYLDPAKEGQVPEEVKQWMYGTDTNEAINDNTHTASQLHPHSLELPKHARPWTNPIDFQAQEKTEGFVRHCGVYVVEMVRVFIKTIESKKDITGVFFTEDKGAQETTLEAVLNEVSSGELKAVKHIRQKHQGCFVSAVAPSLSMPLTVPRSTDVSPTSKGKSEDDYTPSLKKTPSTLERGSEPFFASTDTSLPLGLASSQVDDELLWLRGVYEQLRVIDQLESLLDPSTPTVGQLSDEEVKLIEGTLTLKTELNKLISQFAKQLAVGSTFAGLTVERCRQQVNALESQFRGWLPNQMMQDYYPLVVQGLRDAVGKMEYQLTECLKRKDSKKTTLTALTEQQLRAREDMGYREALARVKKAFATRGYQGHSCYVCYTPPIEIYQQSVSIPRGTRKEEWLLPFLEGLAEDLTSVGITSYVWFREGGESSKTPKPQTFMSKIAESDTVILVGSESMRVARKNSSIDAGLMTELVYIEEKRKRDKQLRKGERVFPVLLSGDERCFPVEYRGGNSPIRDWQGVGDSIKQVSNERGGDYVLHIKRLIGDLYGLSSNREYQTYWDQLEVIRPVSLASQQVIHSTVVEPSLSTSLIFSEDILVNDVWNIHRIWAERNLDYIKVIKEKVDVHKLALITSDLRGVGKTWLLEALLHSYKSSDQKDYLYIACDLLRSSGSKKIYKIKERVRLFLDVIDSSGESEASIGNLLDSNYSIRRKAYYSEETKKKIFIFDDYPLQDKKAFEYLEKFSKEYPVIVTSSFSKREPELKNNMIELTPFDNSEIARYVFRNSQLKNKEELSRYILSKKERFEHLPLYIKLFVTCVKKCNIVCNEETLSGLFKESMGYWIDRLCEQLLKERGIHFNHTLKKLVFLGNGFYFNEKVFEETALEVLNDYGLITILDVNSITHPEVSSIGTYKAKSTVNQGCPFRKILVHELVRTRLEHYAFEEERGRLIEERGRLIKEVFIDYYNNFLSEYACSDLPESVACDVADQFVAFRRRKGYRETIKPYNDINMLRRAARVYYRLRMYDSARATMSAAEDLFSSDDYRGHDQQKLTIDTLRIKIDLKAGVKKRKLQELKNLLLDNKEFDLSKVKSFNTDEKIEAALVRAALAYIQILIHEMEYKLAEDIIKELYLSVRRSVSGMKKNETKEEGYNEWQYLKGKCLIYQAELLFLKKQYRLAIDKFINADLHFKNSLILNDNHYCRLECKTRIATICSQIGDFIEFEFYQDLYHSSRKDSILSSTHHLEKELMLALVRYYYWRADFIKSMEYVNRILLTDDCKNVNLNARIYKARIFMIQSELDTAAHELLLVIAFISRDIDIKDADQSEFIQPCEYIQQILLDNLDERYYAKTSYSYTRKNYDLQASAMFYLGLVFFQKTRNANSAEPLYLESIDLNCSRYGDYSKHRYYTWDEKLVFLVNKNDIKSLISFIGVAELHVENLNHVKLNKCNDEKNKTYQTDGKILENHKERLEIISDLQKKLLEPCFRSTRIRTPDFLMTRRILANLYFYCNDDTAKARPTLNSVLDDTKDNDYKIEYAKSCVVMGFLEEEVGNYEKANNYYQDARKILEKYNHNDDLIIEKFLAIPEMKEQVSSKNINERKNKFICLRKSAGAADKDSIIMEELKLGKADECGLTLLHYLVTYRSEAVISQVSKALVYNVPQKPTYQDRLTPFLLAVMLRNRPLVEVFLKHSRKFLNEEMIGGYSALHLATYMNYPEIVGLLLSYDHDMNYNKRRNSSNNTVLSYATYGNNTQLVNLFKKKKISHAMNSTPFSEEIKADKKILRTLSLSRLDMVDNHDGEDGLHVRLSSQDLTIQQQREVMEFIQSGKVKNIHRCNRFGKSYLTLALENGYYEIVDQLLNKGFVGITTFDQYGLTALHAAISSQYHGVSRLLSLVSAENLKKSNRNWTFAHRAAYAGRLETLKILVDMGITLDVPHYRWYPLHEAIISSSENSLAVIEYILEKAPNQVTKQIEFDITPLHLAALTLDTRKVAMIQKKIKEIKPDMANNLPIDYAMMLQRPEIEFLLLTPHTNVETKHEVCDYVTSFLKNSDKGYWLDVKNKILYNMKSNGHNEYTDYLVKKMGFKHVQAVQESTYDVHGLSPYSCDPSDQVLLVATKKDDNTHYFQIDTGLLSKPRITNRLDEKIDDVLVSSSIPDCIFGLTREGSIIIYRITSKDESRIVKIIPFDHSPIIETDDSTTPLFSKFSLAVCPQMIYVYVVINNKQLLRCRMFYEKDNEETCIEDDYDITTIFNEHFISDYLFVPNTSSLILSTTNGTVYLIDWFSKQLLDSVMLPTAIDCMTLFNNTVYATSNDGVINSFSLTYRSDDLTPSIVAKIKSTYRNAVKRITQIWIHDENTIVCTDLSTFVIELSVNDLVEDYSNHHGWVYDVCVQNKHLYSVSSDKTLKKRNLMNDREGGFTINQPSSARSLFFHETSGTIIVGLSGGVARYRASDGTRYETYFFNNIGDVKTIQAHLEKIYATSSAGFLLVLEIQADEDVNRSAITKLVHLKTFNLEHLIDTNSITIFQDSQTYLYLAGYHRTLSDSLFRVTLSNAAVSVKSEPTSLLKLEPVTLRLTIADTIYASVANNCDIILGTSQGHIYSLKHSKIFRNKQESCLVENAGAGPIYSLKMKHNDKRLLVSHASGIMIYQLLDSSTVCTLIVIASLSNKSLSIPESIIYNACFLEESTGSKSTPMYEVIVSHTNGIERKACVIANEHHKIETHIRTALPLSYESDLCYELHEQYAVLLLENLPLNLKTELKTPRLLNAYFKNYALNNPLHFLRNIKTFSTLMEAEQTIIREFCLERNIACHEYGIYVGLSRPRCHYILRVRFHDDALLVLARKGMMNEAIVSAYDYHYINKSNYDPRVIIKNYVNINLTYDITSFISKLQNQHDITDTKRNKNDHTLKLVASAFQYFNGWACKSSLAWYIENYQSGSSSFVENVKKLPAKISSFFFNPTNKGIEEINKLLEEKLLIETRIKNVSILRASFPYSNTTDSTLAVKVDIAREYISKTIDCLLMTKYPLYGFLSPSQPFIEPFIQSIKLKENLKYDKAMLNMLELLYHYHLYARIVDISSEIKVAPDFQKQSSVDNTIVLVEILRILLSAKQRLFREHKTMSQYNAVREEYQMLIEKNDVLTESSLFFDYLYLLRKNGNFKKLLKNIEIYEKRVGENPHHVLTINDIKIYEQRAVYYFYIGELDNSKDWFKKLFNIIIREKTIQLKKTDYALFRSHYANLCLVEGCIGFAREKSKECISIQNELDKLFMQYSSNETTDSVSLRLVLSHVFSLYHLEEYTLAQSKRIEAEIKFKKLLENSPESASSLTMLKLNSRIEKYLTKRTSDTRYPSARSQSHFLNSLSDPPEDKLNQFVKVLTKDSPSLIEKIADLWVSLPSPFFQLSTLCENIHPFIFEYEYDPINKRWIFEGTIHERYDFTKQRWIYEGNKYDSPPMIHGPTEELCKQFSVFKIINIYLADKKTTDKFIYKSSELTHCSEHESIDLQLLEMTLAAMGYPALTIPAFKINYIKEKIDFIRNPDKPSNSNVECLSLCLCHYSLIVDFYTLFHPKHPFAVLSYKKLKKIYEIFQKEFGFGYQGDIELFQYIKTYKQIMDTNKNEDARSFGSPINIKYNKRLLLGNSKIGKTEEDKTSVNSKNNNRL